MKLLDIGSVISSIGKVADDLVTSDKERIELQLEAQRIGQVVDLAQIEVNKIEAQHISIFVAGWRPAIGWVGVAAMTYQFLLYPMLTWFWAFGQARGWIPAGLDVPPVLDADQLWVILSGILGIAGMRTFEKSRKVA